MGLEQIYIASYEDTRESPSHAVGSEQIIIKPLDLIIDWSPSHTVGLELKHNDGGNYHKIMSPSHTVGSERRSG